MKERIEHIIKAESLTNLQFAQLLDVSPASVTHLLSGRNNPSLDFITRIARKLPHYNLRWLILGEGAIYNNGSGFSTPKQTPDLFSGEDNLKTTEDNSQSLSGVTQHTNDLNNRTIVNSAQKPTNAQQQTLIVCLPDGTYREYTKQ